MSAITTIPFGSEPTPQGSASAMLQASGGLRQSLHDAALLADRQARADRLLEADGAGHLVHDLPVRADGRTASIESRPWRVDPIPVVLEASTFRWLETAVGERMAALESVLCDLYGERALLRERIVPPEILAGVDRYRTNAIGSSPRRWLTTYAVDVALGADGAWRLVQDLTDAPSGIGYAMLDRSVMSRVVADVMTRFEIATLARYPNAMLRALGAIADVDSPRIVEFSGGLDHPSYVDHSYLAVQLGVHLVEGADLVVRSRQVWLRTLDGLEPVDVLYRRVEDRSIDPLDVAPVGSIGVPGLLQAVRSDRVALGNAHGSGVVEAEGVATMVDLAIDRLMPASHRLARLEPATELATVPTVDATGEQIAVGEAPVVLRLFAVCDGESIVVLPGGTGRVLAPGDDPRRPTAATAKDVWVRGRTVAPVVGPRLPQVDFGRSLPTRAADALYWTNRSAERAEAMARTVRVVSSRLEQDPTLALLDGGAWVGRMTRLMSAVRRGIPVPAPDRMSVEDLEREVSSLADGVADEIGTLLTEATTVREYLSSTTGRVLAHLAELRSALRRGDARVDDLDAVLADFAAFTGLWHESTVRGPAWRIGDTGRRLERCLVVLDLVEAALGGDVATVAVAGRANPAADDVEAATIEALLGSNECLVAYRRRYRSDVERPAAISLLVRDATNPRSLAASIELLNEHSVVSGWQAGVDLADQARAALSLPLDELIPTMRAIVEDAGARVVERWFSSPVAPVTMRPTPVGAIADGDDVR